MNSRSASRAPASLARLSPAPIAPRGLVVRCHSAAIPPVARITARARQRERAALARAEREPGAAAVRPWPARSPPRARAPGCARSWPRAPTASRVIRRPVAAPPAWTTRRSRVPALEPEREVAVAVGVELDAELLQVAHARGRLLAQHAHRARASRVAPGGERVRGVLLGRVVVRERGGDPALRPVARGLGERGAAHERDARALRGRHEGGVEAGGAGADDRDVGAGWSRPRARGYGTAYGSAHAAVLPPRLVARARHRLRPPRARRPHPRDRGRAGEPRLARLGAPRGAGGHRGAARCGCIPRSTSRRSASTRSAVRRSTSTRPRAPARTRPRCTPPAARARWPRRCSRGGERTGFSGAAPAGPPRRARHARWASACSPTSRSPRATRSTRSAPSACSSSTGTCTTATARTRSSTTRREVLFVSIHQWPF